METFDFKRVIERYVQEKAMTANQLALFNLLYNDTSNGITFLDIARRMGREENLSTFIGGVTSVLAQDIDGMDDLGTTNEESGCTGWTYLFESVGHDADGIHVRMRKEFREVIDEHHKLKNVMGKTPNEIFSESTGKRKCMV